MRMVAWVLVLGPAVLFIYAYALYPALLALLARRHRPAPGLPTEWPTISISLPAYNEQSQIRGALEALLMTDYPPDRRQILVISDGSTDGTDEIVAEYAGRGVELLRVVERGGKGAAERAGAARLRGEIVVNTDASIRIHAHALKPLVAALADPSVGVASGRDISVGAGSTHANRGETRYVGYEMWIRRLETRLSGIVGASGCFYAIRAPLHRVPLAAHLSRDFASALIAREHGYRAVSVDEATCLVPRTGSLRSEYRRKVRTIARGMETLWAKRHLLNPLREGVFAWMLWSHKVSRWLVPWAAAVAAVGLAVLALHSPVEGLLLGAGLLVVAIGALGWALAERRRLPRLLSIPAFLVAGNVAAMHALLKALRSKDESIWEPTRREVLDPVGPTRR